MTFPPAFLDRLRSHFLLSELIGRRMPLKKAGREFSGLCPFHGEKTPSFTVNNEKGFFHCFGCAAHGDAIEFVKRYEKLTYRETVEKLAREAGLPLPEQSPQAIAQEKRAAGLHEAMEAACAWFESQLARQENARVRDYIRLRGLNEEIRARFRLGFAPDARGALLSHLRQKGFSENTLAEAGLIIRPENGAPYDRFRGRVIFPIRDVRGRIVAFGGRLWETGGGMPGRTLPKYLNSPETPIFHKGELLFNLDQAGPAARGNAQMVIVEGYMDAITMVQGGFPATVATLGTAVTEAHLRKLWQYAPEPVLCLDGDAAGARAMLRAAELVLPLLAPGFGLRFARLPAGEDPDSLLKNKGSSALSEALSAAGNLSETLWSHFSRHTPATPEGRAALEQQLTDLANRIAHPTVKTHYRAFFRDRIWALGAAASGRKTGKKATPEPEKTGIAPPGPAPRSHRQFIKLLLLQPELLHESAVEDHLSQMDSLAAPLAGLREALLSAACEPEILSQREKLNAYLEKRNLAADADAILADSSLMLPKVAAESLTDARRIWRDMAEKDMLAALEAEHRALQHATGSGFDEETYGRMLELQQEIRRLSEKRHFTLPEAVLE